MAARTKKTVNLLSRRDTPEVRPGTGILLPGSEVGSSGVHKGFIWDDEFLEEGFGKAIVAISRQIYDRFASRFRIRQVKPQGEKRHRAAGEIIAGIVDKLKIGGDVDSVGDAGGDEACKIAHSSRTAPIETGPRTKLSPGLAINW